MNQNDYLRHKVLRIFDIENKLLYMNYLNGGTNNER
jgi:hypothetical protein